MNFFSNKMGFSLPKQSQVSRSHKMDLDFWGLLWKRKTGFIAELHTNDLHIYSSFGLINSYLTPK